MRCTILRAFFAVVILCNGLNQVSAAPGSVLVGVLDNGVDLSSRELSARSYLNSLEVPGNGIDDDGNGFVDDTVGWNFADNSNQLYENPYSESENLEMLEYIQLQGKVSSGNASFGDYLIYFYERLTSDKEARSGKFTKMIHGHHVSSIIASHTSERVRLVHLKAYNPYGATLQEIIQDVMDDAAQDHQNARELLRVIFSKIVAERRFDMQRLAAFITVHGIDIVNVSLGDSIVDLTRTASVVNEYYFNSELNEKTIHEVASEFLNSLCHEYTQLVEALPRVWFIVGAGNSGIDLDQHMACPASVRRANTIIVGSISPSGKISEYSNYGNDSIDTYEVGEGVLAEIAPGHKAYLSGTSMAAPLVTAKVARLMIQKNFTGKHDLVASGTRLPFK